MQILVEVKFSSCILSFTQDVSDAEQQISLFIQHSLDSWRTTLNMQRIGRIIAHLDDLCIYHWLFVLVISASF